MHEHNKQTVPPPWQQQGDAMCAALAVNPELQRKIDALQGDLRLRLTDIKLRDQVCPEHLVSCRLRSSALTPACYLHRPMRSDDPETG